MLDLADIEPYLRERGLISARAVVDGGLRVEDHSRLNRVFLVAAAGERPLMVKLADEPGSPGVAREAAVLERVWSAASDELRNFLPAVVEYDGEEGALILEAAPGARDLAHHHARGRFSRTLARQAGRALASVHELDPVVAGRLPHPAEPPAGIRLHQPDLDVLRDMSTAALQLTEVIQRSDEICAGLDELLDSWRSQVTIHGDVRWDNLLAMLGPRRHRWGRLQLIDWEHAAAGDPSLDIGAFLGEYLRAWVQSIPILDSRDPGRLLSHARMPLNRMRPAIRAFWEGYVTHRSCGTADMGPVLQRSVRFAAVRLLTASIEEAQTLGELEPGVLHLVPVSRNLLTRPDDASAHLLGLSEDRDAA